jgi:hypothetical protein
MPTPSGRKGKSQRRTKEHLPVLLTREGCSNLVFSRVKADQILVILTDDGFITYDHHRLQFNR